MPLTKVLCNVGFRADEATEAQLFEEGENSIAAEMITGLVESFSGPFLTDLGDRVGLPESAVKMAAPVVVGLVVSDAKRVASRPGGVEKLTSVLQVAEDRIGDRDLDSFVKEADPSKTADLLHALTGSNSSEQISANLARLTKQDPETIGKTLGIMAPAVMSQMNTLAKDQGLDTQGLADLVDQNADALKGLGDQDDILDDVPGIGDDIQRGLGKLFGRG